MAHSTGDRRKEIIQGIRGIQPVAGKNLRDVEVPQRLYELAKEVAEEEPFNIRFKLVPVYRLLQEHVHVKGQGSVALPQAEATLTGWQQASKALFRYALNLVLAPKRPEFKKMKVSWQSVGHNTTTFRLYVTTNTASFLSAVVKLILRVQHFSKLA